MDAALAAQESAGQAGPVWDGTPELSAAVATMFAVSRVFDAVNDPLMGTVADRTRTRIWRLGSKCDLEQARVELTSARYYSRFVEARTPETAEVRAIG